MNKEENTKEEAQEEEDMEDAGEGIIENEAEESSEDEKAEESSEAEEKDASEENVKSVADKTGKKEDDEEAETDNKETEEEELEEEKAEHNKENEEDEDEEEKEEPKAAENEEKPAEPKSSIILALRTTANREDQVMDFLVSNADKKKLPVYAVVRPHGMRGYIFVEAATRSDAEQAATGIPYARGILPAPINYSEMEHMLEQVKHEINIQKNDIAEIISGPFKREKCKVTRVDKTKEEVVVELLDAAVPIPITLKFDAIKIIRREGEEEEAEEE